MTLLDDEQDRSPLLDEQDRSPLYVQIGAYLKRMIVSGAYPDDSLLPSESELQRMFGTTRGTIRNALAILVSEGMVQQVRGKGTYVRMAPVSHSIWNFGSFTEFARSQQQRPTTKVIKCEVDHRTGEPMLHLVRVRGLKTDSKTVFVNIDESRLSLERFPNLDQHDFSVESLYQVLREEYGVSPHHTELEICAVPPTDLAREWLDLQPSVCCLTQVNGVVHDAAGEIVERTTVQYSPQAAAVRVMVTVGGTDT